MKIFHSVLSSIKRTLSPLTGLNELEKKYDHLHELLSNTQMRRLEFLEEKVNTLYTLAEQNQSLLSSLADSVPQTEVLLAEVLKVVRSGTAYQEVSDRLRADFEDKVRVVRSEATGVRDQLVKDRTTFQESLKHVQSDNAESLRLFKAEVTAVRDQLVKDRTTFQESLKHVQSDYDKELRRLSGEITGVRDQMTRDRALSAERQSNLDKSLAVLQQSSTEWKSYSDGLKEERRVLKRLENSWLHPDYYYRNIHGLMEDRQRLLHRAISLLDPRSSVLDIGPGTCFAIEAFKANGHTPTGIGLKLSSYVTPEIFNRYSLVEADYNTYRFTEPFDAIWASHVLEHQPNKQDFIRKMFDDLKDGGWLFVLVPPMKGEVVGGHLNLFNTGYLLYSLVIGGFDCSEAMVTKYGYNVVVFVRKKRFDMPELRYDEGDLETLAPYFPFEATQNFNGLHLEINWKW